MANEQELITLLSYKVDDKSLGALRLQSMKLSQMYKKLGADTDRMAAQAERLGKSLSEAIGRGADVSAIAEHAKVQKALNEQFDQTTKRMEAIEAQSTLVSEAMKKFREGQTSAVGQVVQALQQERAEYAATAKEIESANAPLSEQEQLLASLGQQMMTEAQQLGTLQAAMRDLNDALAQGAISQEDYNAQAVPLKASIEEQDATVTALTQQYSALDHELRKIAKSQSSAADATKQHNKELAEGRSKAYQYGRVGMSFRAVGRGVSRVAGVPTVEPLFAAGDILRGVRGVILLRTELPDMAAKAAKSAKSIQGLSAATTVMTTAAEVAAGKQGIGALGSALAGIAPVALPVTLALAAAVTIFKHLRDSVEDAKDEIERAIEVNKQYADAISGAASSEVINQIEQNWERIRQAEIRRAGEDLTAPVQGMSIFEATLDATLGMMKTDLGLSKTRAAVDQYRKSIEEAEGEITTLTTVNDKLVEGLRGTETAFEDYMVLTEKFPDAITRATEEQLREFMQHYNAMIGAMTTEDVQDTIAKFEGQVALLEAEWDELERRKAAGALTEADQLRMGQILPQIEQFNFYIDQLTDGLASGATVFADNLANLQDRLGQEDEAFAEASEQLIDKMREIADVRGEMAALVAAPGDVEDVTRKIDDLNAAMAREQDFMETLRQAKEAGFLEETAYAQAIAASSRAVEMMKLRLNLLTDSVLPAAKALERATQMEDVRERALDRAAQRLQAQGDAAVRALTEDDPDAVRGHMRELEQQITNLNTAIDFWSAKLQRGEITADEFAGRLGPLSTEWDALTQELTLTRDILLPAAEANKAYNDELEREKELRLELLDLMQQDMQRRTDARTRALTEDDPDAVIDDMQAIQLEILGWHEYLKDLDQALRLGRITQEQWEDAAHQADDAINGLTKDMRALKNEVLPAAEHTKAFNDLVDEFVAEMELAAEQTRVNAERALQQARAQEDFERQRAKALAEHYADLADMDTKLAEDIQKELEKAGETATDEDKKRLDEEEKFNKQMARLSEDHRLRMLDIARDLSEGLSDAVAERDVQAAIKAIRQAKEKTEEEQEQYELEKKRRWEDYEDRLKQMDDEKKERQKDYRDRIADLRKQHAKERAERINAFNQRIRDEDQERAIAARRQAEDWAREDADRARHYSDQESKAILHYANLKAIAQFGMVGVETSVSEAWNRIVGGLRTFPVIPTRTPAPLYGGTTRYITPYGTGTSRARLDEWVMLGDTGPELARFHGDGRWEVLNPRQTRQELRNQGTRIAISMPVSIYDASNPQQIESIFETRVLPKLTREVSRVVNARGA